VDFVSRWLARAFAAAAVIYAFSEISGAHANPAVTIGFALRRVFPWGLAGGYIVAQFVGALLACGAAWIAFGPALAFGASRPSPGTPPLVAAACEMVLTAIVMVVILGMADNKPAVGKAAAVAVAFAIGACGFFGGTVSGASMNPARSVVPDLLAGQFGSIWIYIVGPLAGAVVAVLLQGALCGEPSERERSAALGSDRV